MAKKSKPSEATTHTMVFREIPLGRIRVRAYRHLGNTAQQWWLGLGLPFLWYVFLSTALVIVGFALLAGTLLASGEVSPGYGSFVGVMQPVGAISMSEKKMFPLPSEVRCPRCGGPLVHPEEGKPGYCEACGPD